VVASVDCCIEIAITEESGIPVFWHMVVVLAVTVIGARINVTIRSSCYGLYAYGSK
jgi:hypothetical protein